MDATDDEVVAAAKIASANLSAVCLVVTTPYLRSDGANLSQGQRRHGCARAAIADLLFTLDEATSSDDTHAEGTYREGHGCP